MSTSVLVRVAGILGGLCWVLLLVLDADRIGASGVDALHWGGAALMVLALVGIGAGLVSGLLALRVVVALCFPALAWALLEVLRDGLPDREVDAVLGAVVALGCLVSLRATPGPRRSRSRGAHARE